ncbi:hypothetical protein BN946_scf184985.g63 [Trametes cinnabarina]|uniref:Uncharacterized protein n=1 Tax=Pycnoporus cinnabarinus TaxID=5643 RepID=A0A060SK73_PYCCI|nr:hypothetical protein BN946_scf184985.g63 [Trametes cinnabarina]
MPAHHAMSNSSVSFSAPSHSHSHSHSTSLDMATFPTSDYDWNLGGLGSGAMDLDLAPSSYERERPAAAPTEPEFKKLEFVDVDAEKLGLSGLDISFDASAARDGRIRVRIHPPGASASSAFFPGAPSPSALGNGEFEFELGSEYGSSSGMMSRAGSPGALSGAGCRRRVRIALRGMPGKGKEGGEWEVEVC